MCEEETVSDQLKANTMVLLVVNGLPPHNVQLGSVKYNEIMRREVAATTNFKSLDCSAKIADAKARPERGPFCVYSAGTNPCSSHL